MRMAPLLAAAAVAVFLLPANAEDEGSNCISEQSDMDACSSPVFTVADAKLNDTYRELRDLLSASEKIRLRDAERVWIAYRDKECEFEAMGSQGGTDHPKEIAVCLADKTNIHLAELRRIVACKRDNDCPWSGN
jgi:uncharacterized protein YecT (DUF1311 family)